MVDSKTPWDFRYQYLAGGVNTGDGWVTWNPSGGFATMYMDASDAAGYIPVFTYYQIVHSLPDSGNDDLTSKLQDSSTMDAYFADWKLLLQQAGGFGKPVIIHHEPDMWGWMQQKSDDPTETAVMVKGSGFPEAAGYEDNGRGFAKLLVAMRDLYAPKAILAWHASGWATGVDLIMNDGDPDVVGNQIGQFFNDLNAAFDLIFVDPSDRDAAYYAIMLRQPKRWFNEKEFSEFRRFAQVIVQKTQKRVMIWQLPLGNTLYRSMNNTIKHWQDNKVQYFLQADNRAHIQEHADAGVIGILIGRGQGDQTSYVDDANDGITNPPPINGNDFVSLFPDDDGGFVRLAAQAYYTQGAIPLFGLSD